MLIWGRVEPNVLPWQAIRDVSIANQERLVGGMFGLSYQQD